MLNEGSYQTIKGEFDIFLVVLSIVFACVASYTALSLNERSKNRSFLNRNFWNALAAIALAFGIWSMHYMGMLAYLLPVKVEYSEVYTIVSMIPILIASFVAFYIINLDKVTQSKAFLSSVIIAVGVAAMHMLGMESMQIEGHHTYNQLIVICALLVPLIGFSVLARFYSSLEKWYMQLFFGVMMGISAAITHYACMYAMEIQVPKSVKIASTMIPYEHARSMSLGLTIGLCVLVVILLLWILVDSIITKHVEKIDTVTHLPNSQQLVVDFQKWKYNQLALWIFKNFDDINKTFGYHCGDEYIHQIVGRIQKELNRSIKIYRIAQNQLLLVTNQDVESFIELQHRLVKLIEHPVFLLGHDKPIEPMAICALSSDPSATNDALLKQVVSISRMPQLTYDFSVITYNQNEHSLNIQDDILRDIDAAMIQKDLFLVYQPKMSTGSNKIVGVEALLRWHHAEYGFISPGIFVPLLEEHGKMGTVTNWVIEQVCMQIEDWKAHQIEVGIVAINIPGDYLTSNELKNCLLETTEKYGVSPSELDLEITETSFVQNLEEAMRAVKYYNELGYGIALDDFGTGLSSLSYLRQMQITTLKVDKSFIDHVPYYKKDVAIAKTIIALGESLNLQVVVEGIERIEQLQFVIAECKNPIVQGYYFAKPLFVSELEEMITKTSLSK